MTLVTLPQPHTSSVQPLHSENHTSISKSGEWANVYVHTMLRQEVDEEQTGHPTQTDDPDHTQIVQKQPAARQLSSSFCQVDGCARNLNKDKEYYRRYRVCKTHAAAGQICMDNKVMRYCQQCSIFHELAAFDNNKRSCRERLSWHNDKRRKRLTRTATAVATRAAVTTRQTRRVSAASALAAQADNVPATAEPCATEHRVAASSAKLLMPPRQVSTAGQHSQCLTHSSQSDRTLTQPRPVSNELGYTKGQTQVPKTAATASSLMNQRNHVKTDLLSEDIRSGCFQGACSSSATLSAHGNLSANVRQPIGTAATEQGHGYYLSSNSQHTQQQPARSPGSNCDISIQAGMWPVQQLVAERTDQRLAPASMERNMSTLLLLQQQQQARDQEMTRAAPPPAQPTASSLPHTDCGLLPSCLPTRSALRLQPADPAAHCSESVSHVGEQALWTLGCAAAASQLVNADEVLQEGHHLEPVLAQRRGLHDPLEQCPPHPRGTAEFSSPADGSATSAYPHFQTASSSSVPASPRVAALQKSLGIQGVAESNAAISTAMAEQPLVASHSACSEAAIQRRQQQQQQFGNLQTLQGDQMIQHGRSAAIPRIHDPRAATSLINVARAAFAAETAAGAAGDQNNDGQETANRPSAFRLYKPIAHRLPNVAKGYRDPAGNDARARAAYSSVPCNSKEAVLGTRSIDADSLSQLGWKERILQKIYIGKSVSDC